MQEHRHHNPEVVADPHGGHGAPAGSDAHAGHQGHAGHDKHAGHSVAMFRDKFWLSLALTVPTLIWGHMLPRVLGYTPPHVPGFHLIPPVLSTVVFFYGGWHPVERKLLYAPTPFSSSTGAGRARFINSPCIGTGRGGSSG
jgi:Cu2+-exporting ATPase